jgi:hypothetical protein
MDQIKVLLNDLKSSTMIALQPSPVHGIGVFAICDIPMGVRNLFSDEKEEDWIRISFEEVESLLEHLKSLIETYCLFDDTHYFVPSQGFKKVDISLFLNHSSSPNIMPVENGVFFETIRPIAKGEELFIDYSTLAQGLDDYNSNL